MIYMKHQNGHNQIEFIHNPDFVKWALNPTEESDQYWNAFLLENPSQRKELEYTRLLVKGFVKNEESLTETEVSALWYKIEQTKFSENRRLIKLKRWSVAAGFLLIIGISGWLMTQRSHQIANSINYQSIAKNVKQDNDIKLILANNTQKTFTSKEVDLKYDQDGKLVTKTGKQVETEELDKSAEILQMNQLVVPRGKRSNIELADGTKLWLNSGSRAIYPVAFTGKTREIYIEGEGYLEVTHDVLKPFYVVTDQIKVKVLGTKFDISAYKEDDHVSVVLVEGSVQALTSSESRILKPNQILNYKKLSQKSTIERINVMESISWKDGWLLCNKESIKSIITKLSRYYNIKINFNDQSLGNITLTGKLDLKSNYEDIFKVICTTAPLKYGIIDNSIYLKLKE